MQNYWFKPKRFWQWFAAYYPVSWQGWLVFSLAVILILFLFFRIDSWSHSVSDTFYGIALPFILVLLVVDWTCLKTGEYPSWWRHRRYWFPKKES